MVNDQTVDLSKQKLSALKTLCRERKLAVSGTKAVLIGRLEAFAASITSTIARSQSPKNSSIRGAQRHDGTPKKAPDLATFDSRSSGQVQYSDAQASSDHVFQQPSLAPNAEISRRVSLPRESAAAREISLKASASKSGHQLGFGPSKNQSATLVKNMTPLQKYKGPSSSLMQDPRRTIENVPATGNKHILPGRASDESAIPASKRMTTTSTRRFLTPFKNTPGLVHRPIDPAPCFEKFSAWKSIDSQLEWFNNALLKLLGCLAPHEQNGLQVRGFGIIEKASLLSIALDNTENAVAFLRFLVARIYNKLSTMEEEGCSLASVLTSAPVIKVERLATGLCCATLSGTGQMCFLASTGEVVGTGLAYRNKNSDGARKIRSDWQNFVDGHANDATSISEKLLSHVKTSDCDTYTHGISRHFLETCRDGELLELAMTYVLANLAPNGTSGRWMSIFESCAEFNGIRVETRKRLVPPSDLSLFLPSAHYVEKVYKTAENGLALHEAICAIQTSNRTHLCLSLIGQVIGNGEEGVVPFWKGLLGCDDQGVKSCLSNSR